MYQDDPDISAMASLRTAYEQNDITSVDKLLANGRIVADPFIKTHVQDLLQKIRLQVPRMPCEVVHTVQKALKPDLDWSSQQSA